LTSDVCEHGGVNDLVQRAERAGTRIIRFQFCDYVGIVHAKAVHVSILEQKLREGIGSTLAQTALNVRDELVDIPEMPPVGEVRIVPDRRRNERAQANHGIWLRSIRSHITEATPGAQDSSL
jgi:glutamine synthetase